jgi:lipopolysaccharide/colanic/teichoic acid biosynthesis glycosyltransferase
VGGQPEERDPVATRRIFVPHRLPPAERALVVPEADTRDGTLEIIPPLASSPVRRRIKRCVDVVLGVIGLLVLLPLAVLISLAIVIDSPGSPIYVHRRMGRRGVEFGLLKFRTMTRGAEERPEDFLRGRPEAFREWQLVRKVRSDPRVTRMGRILRRCSLDEVPQLINVMRGQMSLVGPRSSVSLRG